MPIRMVQRVFYELSDKAKTCSMLTAEDRTKMRALVEHSNQDGKERGFVKCADGSYSSECKGTECRVRLKPESCNESRVVLNFHAHVPVGVHPEALPEEFTSVFSTVDLCVAKGYGISCLGFAEKGGAKVKCIDGDKVNLTEANLLEMRVKGIINVQRPRIKLAMLKGVSEEEVKKLTLVANRAIIDTVREVGDKYIICEEDLGRRSEGLDPFISLDRWLEQ